LAGAAVGAAALQAASSTGAASTLPMRKRRVTFLVIWDPFSTKRFEATYCA
jgi:hypothetical protein